MRPPPPEPQHGIFLPRLILAAADQFGILVTLEVAQVDDHILRIEGRFNHCNPLCQLVDKEFSLVRVPCRDLLISVLSA